MKKDWEPLNKKNWKEVISRAAASLFYEHGYLETSMENIAAAAKLSKGGIYHYFSNKNEILFFISTNFMDLILKDLESELEKINSHFLKIQFIISRHIELYIKYMPEAKTLFFEKHLLSPKYFKIIAEKERKYLQILVRILSGFFGGMLPEDKLNVVAFSLFGMCNNIYHWYDPRGAVPPKELASVIHGIFYGGLERLLGASEKKDGWLYHQTQP
jgi:AcrR family transcriptional regulator